MIRVLMALLIFLVACPSWAATTYVGGQVGGFAGTTSAQTIPFALSGGSDATPQAGDTVIASYCVGNNVDLTFAIRNTGATDYTAFGTELYRDDSSDANLRTAYRVMPGTPETDIVFTETVTGGTGTIADAGSYLIQVFRGVHATPLEQAVQEGTGINTIIVNPGGLTPTTTGTVVYVVGCGALSTGVTYTSSDLTAFLTTNTVDTIDASIGGGYFEWTSGAFNPATFGIVGSDSAFASYAWHIVALAPAADAPAAAGSPCGALMLLGVRGC